MDGGGSNSSRHYIFKQDLQTLADEIGVEIRIVVGWVERSETHHLIKEWWVSASLLPTLPFNG
jgi:hypothetical protein